LNLKEDDEEDDTRDDDENEETKPSDGDVKESLNSVYGNHLGFW
jgi:hypothetical protein